MSLNLIKSPKKSFIPEASVVENGFVTFSDSLRSRLNGDSVPVQSQLGPFRTVSHLGAVFGSDLDSFRR